jgi:hypothetical protein
MTAVIADAVIPHRIDQQLRKLAPNATLPIRLIEHHRAINVRAPWEFP